MYDHAAGKKHNISFKPSIAVQAGLFTIVLILFLFGVRTINAQSVKCQEENLKTALAKDIVYCYAQDGRYPDSLEYIRKNCGLTYDEELFYVDYRNYGTNVLPDYTVIRLDEEER